MGWCSLSFFRSTPVEEARHSMAFSWLLTGLKNLQKVPFEESQTTILFALWKANINTFQNKTIMKKLFSKKDLIFKFFEVIVFRFSFLEHYRTLYNLESSIIILIFHNRCLQRTVSYPAWCLCIVLLFIPITISFISYILTICLECKKFHITDKMSHFVTSKCQKFLLNSA